MEIGKKIKQLRKEKGLSQRELADYLDITSNSVVCGWEKGLTEPRPNMRRKIANFFGISEAELYVSNELESIKKEYGAKLSGTLRPIPIFKASCGFFEQHFDGDHPIGIADEYMNFYSNDPNAFFVRCYGDSMIGADIREGDLLLVEPNNELINGCLCFCKCNVGCSVKKYTREDNGTVILVPMNEKYKPTILKPEDEPICYRVKWHMKEK